MSEETIRQLNARLDEMSKRIDQLQAASESPKPVKKWYQPSNFVEFSTLIGVPAALIAGLWGFYDGVWLKLQRLDSATTAAAQDKLTELQGLRSEIFLLQARRNDAEVAALLEAKASRRDRLVKESYLYWQAQPNYFTEKETMLLAQELQLQHRQPEALEVLNTVTAVGSIQKADLDRFKGSLYGAEGVSFDLDSARQHYKSALTHASDHSSEAGRQQLWSKITYSWLVTELSNRSDCSHVAPVAEMLTDLLADDPDDYNLGVLAPDARKLIEVAYDRCSDGDG